VNHVIAQIVRVKQKKNVKTVLPLVIVVDNYVTAAKIKSYEKIKIKY
jgi:hypothetical protein